MTLQECLSLASAIMFAWFAVSQFLLAHRYRKVLASNKILIMINRELSAIMKAHHEEHKRACRYAPEPFTISAN